VLNHQMRIQSLVCEKIFMESGKPMPESHLRVLSHRMHEHLKLASRAWLQLLTN
jgi:hypothetical protein